jgi:predicted ribosomally synthesized peptide with nif11-like leader
MRFIAKVRAHESLRARVQQLGRAADLESVVKIAEEEGYPCSVDDLQVAFRQDWALRWIFYRKRAQE